jgi:hypothetical protein
MGATANAGVQHSILIDLSNDPRVRHSQGNLTCLGEMFECFAFVGREQNTISLARFDATHWRTVVNYADVHFDRQIHVESAISTTTS